MKKAVEAVKAATQMQRKAPGSAELLNCLSAVEGQIQVVAAEERPALLEGMPLNICCQFVCCLLAFGLSSLLNATEAAIQCCNSVRCSL